MSSQLAETNLRTEVLMIETLIETGSGIFNFTIIPNSIREEFNILLQQAKEFAREMRENDQMSAQFLTGNVGRADKIIERIIEAGEKNIKSIFHPNEVQESFISELDSAKSFLKAKTQNENEPFHPTIRVLTCQGLGFFFS